MFCRRALLSVFFATVYSNILITGAFAGSPTYLPQAFYFDYNIEGQAFPIPVTRQCETIHIKWDRADATGPNPKAPYTLQIYTSNYVVPFTIDAGNSLSFDYTVPFAPGTVYQICMFDSVGATGGCQNMYTVIESTDTSCTNVTFPAPLDVEATVANGPLSQYGWVDSCTDISLRPTNGTPPYSFTAAPALHPPFNVSSKADSFNWTVALDWAMPFFISVVDAEGRVWSQGPLHGGGKGTTSCLNTDGDDKSTISVLLISLTTAGSLVIGTLAGILSTYFFLRRRWHRKEAPLSTPWPIYSPDTRDDSSHYPLLHSTYGSESSQAQGRQVTLSRPASNSALDYHIEPFLLPTAEDGTLVRSPHERDGTTCASPVRKTVLGHSTRDSRNSGYEPARSESGRAVYVVHHDGGRAPVTVYADDGTEVVELPPHYADSRAGAGPSGHLIPPGRGDNPKRRPH